MKINETVEQLCMFDQDSWSGKMSPEPSPQQTAKISGRSSKKPSELQTANYLFLDLRPGGGNLLGPCWEQNSPLLGAFWTLSTGASPKDAVESSLSQILQAQVPLRYYLSKTACLGILRRADVRGKELPPQLKEALEIQAGIASADASLTETVGFDGYNGDLTGDKAATLGVNCGMSTGRNGVIGRQPTAFAANQRDEVRDMHDVAGALGAQPGMKQQTFVAETCLTPWDVQSRRIFEETGTWPALYSGEGGGHGYVKTQRPVLAAGVVSKGNGDCFLTAEKHTALTGGGGQAGQGYPCVMAAGFCAGASPTAGNIGYQEEVSPTLKAADSGTNMVPSILCLNDQGGAQMHCTEDKTGTLRAQEHGHQPLVFDNHSQDSRYKGPVNVSQTVSAGFGMGGNNVPLVSQENDAICIVGNAIDRQPQNGGNGQGWQTGIAYTLTATDHHAVFNRQRVDQFAQQDVASTQSARQCKDATDLVCYGQAQFANYKEGVSTLRAQGGDHGGGSENLIADMACYLIRRLTPMECERLQGFPDGWTDIPNASDSARYKALGNSVAIPCVEFVLCGIAAVLHAVA